MLFLALASVSSFILLENLRILHFLSETSKRIRFYPQFYHIQVVLLFESLLFLENTWKPMIFGKSISAYFFLHFLEQYKILELGKIMFPVSLPLHFGKLMEIYDFWKISSFLFSFFTCQARVAVPNTSKYLIIQFFAVYGKIKIFSHISTI